MRIIRNTHTIVQVTGEIDLYNAEPLRSALNEASDRSPGGFIVDLTECTYLDSAAVQAILDVYRKMRPSEGRLILVYGNPRIHAVMYATRLELLPGVSVCASLDDAKQALSAPDTGRGEDL